MPVAYRSKRGKPVSHTPSSTNSRALGDSSMVSAVSSNDSTRVVGVVAGVRELMADPLRWPERTASSEPRSGRVSNDHQRRPTTIHQPVPCRRPGPARKHPDTPSQVLECARERVAEGKRNITRSTELCVGRCAGYGCPASCMGAQARTSAPPDRTRRRGRPRGRAGADLGFEPIREHRMREFAQEGRTTLRSPLGPLSRRPSERVDCPNCSDLVTPRSMVTSIAGGPTEDVGLPRSRRQRKLGHGVPKHLHRPLSRAPTKYPRPAHREAERNRSGKRVL